MLLILLIIIIILYFLYNNKKEKGIKEEWRDLPFIGTKDMATYNPQQQNYSRKSLPVYYPISSPLEDDYFNYTNSMTSPKLSMLRNVLREVEVYTNQGLKPLMFNYAERPFTNKKPDLKKIGVLSKTVIDLINQYGDPFIKVKLDGVLNEIHEETDEQSRIGFDMKLKVLYNDSEMMGKRQKLYDVYIQPEFLFEKNYNMLPEDQFFIDVYGQPGSSLLRSGVVGSGSKALAKDNSKVDFKAFLSKLIVIGSAHTGFLSGRYMKNNRKN
jgi:hypothetical protein